MTTNDLQLRLRFLKEAAYTLAISSPTIAASLGAAHRTLLTENDIDIEIQSREWDALRRGICGSCGNVMMSGWTSSISRNTPGAKKTKKDQTGPRTEPEKSVIYTCQRCDRKTVQKLQPRPSKHMATKSKAKTIASLDSSSAKPSMEGDSKIGKSASANSKQRKKTRKGGLQALLEKSKASTSSPGGLDLMDFMQ
jgi:cobalamin biosynthesis Mg chelatase CobN